VFQENALFDSLTVDENVGYRLYEEDGMPLPDVRRRVAEILGFIGLGEYIDRRPSELSGGQRRRVALARALVTRPGLLLFDDPTTGLDPLTALSVDDQIVKLRDLEHVTSVVATHQMRDAFYVATHRAQRIGAQVQIVKVVEPAPELAQFMVLNEGNVVFQGDGATLLGSTDPFLTKLVLNALPPW
jgi:phospholipid/cholesterol/gamma-HCH transport system ATP-binding protein